MNDIGAVRLLALRGMLRLEKVGLKGSAGAIRPRIAGEFGLSPRAPHDTYINMINARLEQQMNNKHRVMQVTETSEEFWAFEGSEGACLEWIKANADQFEESTFYVEPVND